MYPYIYHSKTPFHSLFTPTKQQVYLSRQNAILNREVDILMTHNRRLRTELLMKDYSNLPQQNSRKLTYAKGSDDKYEKQIKKYREQNVLKKYQPQYTRQRYRDERQELSMTFAPKLSRKTVSADKGINSHKYRETRTREKSAPKCYYELAHTKIPERQKGTIIEELQQSTIKNNPELFIQTSYKSPTNKINDEKTIEINTITNKHRNYSPIRQIQVQEVFKVCPCRANYIKDSPNKSQQKRNNRPYAYEKQVSQQLGTTASKLRNIKYMKNQTEKPEINFSRNSTTRKNYLTITSKLFSDQNQLKDSQKEKEK